MRLLRFLVDGLDIKKTLYGLACGKFTESPFGAERVRHGHMILIQELGARRARNIGLDPAEGQTIMLKELGALLKLSADPDWRIMAEAKDSYLTGTPGGQGAPA